MFQKILALSLLLHGLGGCFWRGDRGRDRAEPGNSYIESGRDREERGRDREERGGDREKRGREEEHRDHTDTAVVDPEHVHRSGCGHVLRGCVWVGAD